jgi:pimeloyl-ACP methyl ester carboxylesterase
MRGKWMDCMTGVLVLFLAGSAFAQKATAPAATAAIQPRPPLHGPGSGEVTSHTVIRMKIADGGKGGWLFLPSNPSPKKAPVIIFCHGWGAILPRGYQAWVDHLVMRGNIVLWPNYQDNLLTPTRQFLPNALDAVKVGLLILQSPDARVRPDLDRVAVVGHSAGGMVAAGIAASAASEGLPEIRAVMSVEPGDTRRGGARSVPLADMSKLPSETLLLILVGEEDTSVGTYDGERILHESVAVPLAGKALLMLHSDDHGSPALVANHFSPSAMVNPDGTYAKEPTKPAISRNTIDIGIVDALDYFGTWRLLDQLLDAAFQSPRKDQPLQDRAILSMGNWSDGVPVKPLTRLQ